MALGYFFISNDAPIIHGNVIHHIEYKTDLTLDLYLPTNQIYEKSPVVVFLHGGAWITGSKEAININRFNQAINVLRNLGYSIISPNYTLARNNKAPFPDCIIDAYDAMQWIKENAYEYNFDLKNIGIFGESAGAHIAMMSAYASPEVFNKHDLELPVLNYVVDVYGPSDLSKLYHMQSVDSISALLARLPDPLKECLDITQHLFGFDPDIETEKAKQFMTDYSPVEYVNHNAPPTLMIHGKEDQIVPMSQTLILKYRLDSSNISNELHILENVDHAFRGANQQQRSNVQEWIVNFIQRNYKNDS
jgi:acetyl esterase/lipase